MDKIHLEKDQAENLLCGLCPHVTYTKRIHGIIENMLNGERLSNDDMRHINNGFTEHYPTGQMQINGGKWRLTWNRVPPILSKRKEMPAVIGAVLGDEDGA